MRRIIGSLLIFGALFWLQTAVARAAAPTLSLTTTGDGDNVQLTTSGDPNASVLIYFLKTDGTSRLQYLGTTNASGYYSTTISTATLGVTPDSSVQVKINNQQSSSVNWPYTTVSGAGAIALSKTGLILRVGETATLSVNNIGSNKIYLLNNSNPQIANINLSGNQVTIYANTYGQTVATVCVLGTTSNCSSTYITVQNSGATALTFSQSTLTIAYGQSSQVSILNSTSNYTILNNSNPSVITASLSNQTITLTASNNGGSAAITVCSSDMSACGIINATVGTVSSATLTFNQSAPSLTIGQTLSVAISGGGSNYNISSNSNTSVLTASVSGNTLTLIGGSAGSATVTVCSSSGNCNSLTATVSYASNGGPITLSQSNLWLQIGQAVSVVISGGVAPYSFINTASSSNYFQTSLNNNILTLTGVSAGSASISVCSSGGACTQLAVLVNGVTTNTQLTFSNNNLNLKTGNNSEITIYGAGGYYISNTNNQNVATFTLNTANNKITVNALSSGNANATVCQSGGQCGVIYVSVSATDTNVPVTFSQNNPTIAASQTLTVIVSGGSNNTYFISSNSNPAILQANISGSNLTLLGKAAGPAVVTVCSANNNCSSMAVTVSSSSSTAANTNSGTTDNGTTTSGTTGDNVNSPTAINEAKLFFTNDIGTILKNANLAKNAKLEATVKAKNLNALIKSYKLTAGQINSLLYFLTYGSSGTLKIGASERASILASYIFAFNQVPKTEAQWSDLLNIAAGNKPVVKSTKAENQAKLEFAKVYDRAASLNSAADQKALIYIAYGLRPSTRNIASEAQAIKTFRAVYRHAPVSTLAWNIVRAIAYSGVIN
jgi:ferredoxin